MKARRKLILVTNDDGHTAQGITHLVKLMMTLGDVICVAPDRPRSGMGHAITIADPLRFIKVSEVKGIEEYLCNGTPVDCVKLALGKIVPRKPDLIVSGINHGSNSSVNVIYSGTMAAAIEGSLEGVPSLGFSVTDYSPDIDFTTYDKYIISLCKKVLTSGLPDFTCLNVNMPYNVKIKGIRVCRQANAFWADSYIEHKDPHHRSYYWLTGKFVSRDKGKDTDEWALKNNYIAIVPISFDFTAHHAIGRINKLLI